jgi:hypothetical protein
LGCYNGDTSREATKGIAEGADIFFIYLHGMFILQRVEKRVGFGAILAIAALR